jgi:hypothetical protein
MLFPSAAALAHIIEKYHAVEGGQQTLARLGEHLEGMRRLETAGVRLFGKEGEQGGLEIIRLFDAPPQVVFDAWTSPERLARWWGPKGFTLPTCTRRRNKHFLVQSAHNQYYSHMRWVYNGTVFEFKSMMEFAQEKIHGKK